MVQMAVLEPILKKTSYIAMPSAVTQRFGSDVSVYFLDSKEEVHRNLRLGAQNFSWTILMPHISVQLLPIFSQRMSAICQTYLDTKSSITRPHLWL